MTGGLLIHSTSNATKTIDAGLLLEIAGSASGRHLHAQDLLTASGKVLFESNAKYATGAVVIDVNASGTGVYIDSEATNAPVLALDGLGQTNAAPHILFGYRGTFDVNLFRSAANILYTDDSLHVKNMLSGATLYALNSLRSSGSVVWEGTASGAKIRGLGLTDCDGSTSKLLWDVTNGTFSCGTDVDTNTTYSAGQGITLANTVFSLSPTHSGTTIEATSLLSGAIVHAQNELRSSGTLVVEGATVLNGSVTITAGALANDTILEGDLKSVDAPGDEEILTYESTGGDFEWQTCADITGSAGLCDGSDADTTYSAAQGLTLLAGNAFRLNATISGSLLEFSTVSGATVYGADSLRSSGSIVWEGTASGAKIRGLGLVDCDNAATSKLLWDTTSGTFSCGTDTDTDTNTTYLAGQGLSLNGTLFTLSATHSGSTVEFTTLGSGAILHAQNQLRSSGTLIVEGAVTFAGVTSCENLQTASNGALSCNTTDYITEVELDTEAELETQLTDVTNVFTENDGSLADDNLGNNTLDDLSQTSLADPNADRLVFWDDSETAFAFLTPDSNDFTISTTTLTINEAGIDHGGLGGLGDDDHTIYVLASGARPITGDFEIQATASGRVLHAQDMLRSSGSLVVETNSAFSNGNILFSSSGQTVFNAGSTDVDFLVKTDTNTGIDVDGVSDTVGILTPASRTTAGLVSILGVPSQVNRYGLGVQHAFTDTSGIQAGALIGLNANPSSLKRGISSRASGSCPAGGLHRCGSRSRSSISESTGHGRVTTRGPLLGTI